MLYVSLKCLKAIFFEVSGEWIPGSSDIVDQSLVLWCGIKHSMMTSSQTQLELNDSFRILNLTWLYSFFPVNPVHSDKSIHGVVTYSPYFVILCLGIAHHIISLIESSQYLHLLLAILSPFKQPRNYSFYYLLTLDKPLQSFLRVLSDLQSCQNHQRLPNEKLLLTLLRQRSLSTWWRKDIIEPSRCCGWNHRNLIEKGDLSKNELKTAVPRSMPRRTNYWVHG